MNQQIPPQQNQPPQQPPYPAQPPQQPPYPAQTPQTPYPVQPTQGQYPTPYAPQYPQPYAAQPKTNSLCIASLATALAPLVLTWIPILQWFGLLSSIAAIILGAMGLKKVKESNGAETGKGLAVAGIVIGAVDILLFIIVVIIAGLIVGNLINAFGNYPFY